MMKAIILCLFLASFVINVTANENSAQAENTVATQENSPSSNEETSVDKGTPQSTQQTANDDTTAQSTQQSSNDSSASVPVESNIANEKSAQAYIKSAVYAEQHGNPILARQILKEAYQETQKIEILSQWIVMDEAMFQALKQKNQHHSFTDWQTDFEQKCLKKQPYSGHCSDYDRHKELLSQENNVIPIPDIEIVTTILNNYKQLKNSLTEIRTVLDSQELDTLKESSNQVSSLIRQVQRTRCDYLSFDVVSPYLARTEQLIFISKINKPEVSSILTLVPDQSIKKLRGIEILREASSIFAQVADFDMIVESHSSVRKQFFNVYDKFQEAGGTKFEEFKAIKTVADQVKLKHATIVPCEERWWGK